ncbi:MAG: cytochrome c, partial [Planctomycetota bacterium]|nr:cytochrome c [Planctomycetota bacterium]
VEPELDWVSQFPEQIREKLGSEKEGLHLYARGKRQFDIYCSVCHGYAGYGDGLVSNRGMALNLQQKAEWVKAKSLFDSKVLEQPVGRIFDTVTNGRGAMGPYRSQITAEDRWAIIFFVKALQNARQGKASDVPEDVRLQSWEQVNPEPVTENSNENKETDNKK